jgi:hypothetical protein
MSRATVRLADKLRDEERRQLFEWADPFGMRDLSIQWRTKDHHFIAEVSGRPVSYVGVVRQTVSVGSTPVLVGGIGGVVTPAQEQGRGYATLTLEHAVTFLRDTLKVEFGFLFCSDRLIPFYRRQGWELVAAPVTAEQTHASPLVMPVQAMVLPFGGRTWPTGPVNLESLPW